MIRALDGTHFAAYCQRLQYDERAQHILKTIRTSPPIRTPQAARGNVPVWFPSRKMGCVIKAESHKVEFARLLQDEHDPDVLEMYDQPHQLTLHYADRRGRKQHVEHTADFFEFRLKSAGWIECKPEAMLLKLAVSQPNRYQLDECGQWRCPPGEAAAGEFDLTYQVYSTAQINWNLQRNWLYLEDYYQDLDRLIVPDNELKLLHTLVSESPGINLADLCEQAQGISVDHINIAIAYHQLYLDMSAYCLGDRMHATLPIYLTRDYAVAVHHVAPRHEFHPSSVRVAPGTIITWGGVPWRLANVGVEEVTLLNEQDQPLSLTRGAFETLVREGRIVGGEGDDEHNVSPLAATAAERLDHASISDMAIAVSRDRTIHPELYHDDEQLRGAAERAAVPERTQRHWRKLYADAEATYGNGLIGLLPIWSRSGRRPLDDEQRTHIHAVLSHTDSLTVPIQWRHGQTYASGGASEHRRPRTTLSSGSRTA